LFGLHNCGCPSCTDRASTGTSYPAYAGQITVTGSDKDIQTFKDMIKACRKKSRAFDKMISDIENDKTRGGNVSVDVGRSGAYVDNATGGMGHTDVNLSNVEQFPDPDVDDKGHIKDMPKGVPPWATTRCEIIAHFLREAHSTAATQSKNINMGHQAGIACQNEVRANFGQMLRCVSSINHYADEEHFSGFEYTQISYGGSANEKLRFDSSGKLTISYYSSGNTAHVPPKEPEKPKAPTAKANGKDGASGSGSGISYDNPSDGYVVAPPVQQPINCFGDVACEREVARQRGIDINRGGSAPAAGVGEAIPVPGTPYIIPGNIIPGAATSDTPCLPNAFQCANALRTNSPEFSKRPQAQPNSAPANARTSTPNTNSPPSNNTPPPRP
jgi:hypothetical protein